MKAIKGLGLAVATPALVVALAQPSDAAARGVVAFAGTIEIRPTALPQQQTLQACFFGVGKSCANGAESSGMAAGPAVDTAIGADALDGLQASATYTEVCAPGAVLQPVATATLTGNVHKGGLANAWSAPVSATWTRAGLVAVIQGDAVGAALVTPIGVPACGAAVPVAVAGAVELAY